MCVLIWFFIVSFFRFIFYIVQLPFNDDLRICWLVPRDPYNSMWSKMPPSWHSVLLQLKKNLFIHASDVCLIFFFFLFISYFAYFHFPFPQNSRPVVDKDHPAHLHPSALPQQLLHLLLAVVHHCARLHHPLLLHHTSSGTHLYFLFPSTLLFFMFPRERSLRKIKVFWDNKLTFSS